MIPVLLPLLPRALVIPICLQNYWGHEKTLQKALISVLHLEAKVLCLSSAFSSLLLDEQRFFFSFSKILLIDLAALSLGYVSQAPVGLTRLSCSQHVGFWFLNQG